MKLSGKNFLVLFVFVLFSCQEKTDSTKMIYKIGNDSDFPITKFSHKV